MQKGTIVTIKTGKRGRPPVAEVVETGSDENGPYVSVFRKGVGLEVYKPEELIAKEQS